MRIVFSSILILIHICVSVCFLLPTRCSVPWMKLCCAQSTDTVKHDLWIVGTGTLGEILLRKYHEAHPEQTIVAETGTTKRHAQYQAQYSSPNVQLRVRTDRNEAMDTHSARNVVICIPPSSSADYAQEVSHATALWAGPEHGGRLLFVSSAAVYGDVEKQTVIVTETTPLARENPRAMRLIAAEEKVLSRQGKVVRMSGLYTQQRGAHTYWMHQRQAGDILAGNANGYVNLIHYEDAAQLCLAILATKETDQSIFIGVDEETLTREEIYQAARNAMRNTHTANEISIIPEAIFATRSEMPEGRITANPMTRMALPTWRPKYTSFKAFMEQLASTTSSSTMGEL